MSSRRAWLYTVLAYLIAVGGSIFNRVDAGMNNPFLLFVILPFVWLLIFAVFGGIGVWVTKMSRAVLAAGKAAEAKERR